MHASNAYKILEIRFKGNIFKFGVEWKEYMKNVRFNPKTGHILESVRNRTKIILITNRKWHTPY